MCRSIFGGRGELAVGLGRCWCDLLGSSLLGRRLLVRAPSQRGLSWPAPFSRQPSLPAFAAAASSRLSPAQPSSRAFLAGCFFAGGVAFPRRLARLGGAAVGGAGGGGGLRGGSAAGSGVSCGRSCASAIRMLLCRIASRTPARWSRIHHARVAEVGWLSSVSAGQGLFRMAHSAPPPTRITAPRTKGQMGRSSGESWGACAAGPGVPGPAPSAETPTTPTPRARRPRSPGS